MKNRVTVWTLAWDNKNGTGCRVFGSESEWMTYFKGIILAEITDIQTTVAEEIRRLLQMNEIGDAYELWQENYKSELDSYNWDTNEIEVELELEHA